MSEQQDGPAHQPVHNPAHTEDEAFDISRLIAILLAGKWWIVVCLAIGIAIAYGYLTITPNTYSANALLQIQARSPSPLSGLGNAGPGIGGAASFLGFGESTAQSQIPIIKSRLVLGKSVRQLNLATSVHPQRLPIIGGSFANKNATAIVPRFDVPDALMGKTFRLKVVDAKHYRLYGPAGQRVLKGVIGEQASGKTASGQTIQMFVRGFQAQSMPVTFAVSKHAWLSAVTALQNNIVVQEVGNGSGIVTLTLQGQNLKQVTRIVNSVAQNYVDQNVEARSKEAQKSLKFLKGQLPQLKSKVNTAEANLAQYQESHQPVDLTAQAQALLQRTSALAGKRSQLKLKISELEQTYTPQYPEVQAARDQLQQLKQQRQQLQKQIQKLPRRQKQMLGLQRNVKVQTQLYTGLLNQAQQLQVVKAGTVGNVRIVDKANDPISRIAPRSKLVLFIFIVLGLMVGIAIVLLRAAFRRGVTDPQAIERQTGRAVYAVIPHSGWLGRATRRAVRAGRPAPILVRDRTEGVVSEALRSLRTSLYFAQMEVGGNALILTGPAPGVGKSFISINLGYLLTQVDQRTVVVDADMRRGRLHEFLGTNRRGQGLAEWLAGGQVDLGEIIQRVPETELDVITSGAIPSNPSELLMRPRFKKAMDELKSRYDLVIVDAPPVLAVTDAAVITAAMENPLSFMVLSSGNHSMEEINQAVNRLTRQHGTITGFILNDYQTRKARAAYGEYQYQYSYRSTS